MKRIFPGLFLVILIFVFGLGMGVAGWFVGLRDGTWFAYSDMANKLPAYYGKIPDGDPVRTRKFLDLYTAIIACHLLGSHHPFQIYALQPYEKAKGALMNLRAVWHPDEALFQTASRMVTRYPMESGDEDYFAAWQQVQPMQPRIQTPPEKSPPGTN